MKKQLIKETDHSGTVYYYIEVNGDRKSCFFVSEVEAKKYFDTYGNPPQIEVILEAEINQKNK
jgi:hypothetical protein